MSKVAIRFDVSGPGYGKNAKLDWYVLDGQKVVARGSEVGAREKAEAAAAAAKEAYILTRMEKRGR